MKTNFMSSLTALFFLFFSIVFAIAGSAQSSWIRINQLGYLQQDVKVAVWVSKENVPLRSFTLHDAASGQQVYQSSNCRAYGAYAAFSSSCRLNFSDFGKEGTYYIRAGGVASPIFKISNSAYNGTADFVMQYMRQQRSKYNPFLKDSCHTSDGFIVYHPNPKKDSTRLDVAGGWHDASDYLQYLPTSANATFQMLFAYMKHPQSFEDRYDTRGHKGGNGIPDILDEAKWGLDWLVKMNPAKGEYYNQIADDRDHRGMRLPTLDTVKYAENQGLARPVYFITGKVQGEKYKNNTRGAASSVAKFASAFALGYKVLQPFYPEFARQLLPRAVAAYEFAKANPGNTQTISMVSPYIYAEDNYVDDMQLAALVLYDIQKKSGLQKDAFDFARQEPVTPWMGADTARHYQWYPFVNLGHYFGAKQKNHPDAKEYIRFMKMGIDRVLRRGSSNPFLMGVPFIWCSNNLNVGILTQVALYKSITGDRQYDEFEAALRDWLFGCNPWGTSMICDLPENGIAPKDPHSAFTQLYKYNISGGLVDGPVYGTIWDKLIGIKLYNPDEFAHFQSDLVVYHDDYGDYSTNEPTMDGTASLSYYLSYMQAMGARASVFDSQGAQIKIPTKSKALYLIFSAHDYGEGGELITRVLQKNKAKASFFFTGDFLRNPSFNPLIKKIKQDGHYIGSHSNKHLLYADWQQRDSLLIDKTQFVNDIQSAQKELGKLGIAKGNWFLPPYEWYNRKIVDWSRELGLTVINFTPGTGTNADYTTPDMKNYRSSEQLLQHLFEVEQKKGLEGNLILVHLGTAPERSDKFYNKLDKILEKLRALGYTFAKLP